MMIKSKNSTLILLVTIFLVACNRNPTDLAKDYCNCRAEIEKGTKSEQDCASLAESHTLKIQDDQNALTTYTSAILDCISNTEMTKEK